jgi:hypothetical protein
MSVPNRDQPVDHVVLAVDQIEKDIGLGLVGLDLAKEVKGGVGVGRGDQVLSGGWEVVHPQEFFPVDKAGKISDKAKDQDQRPTDHFCPTHGF